MSHLFALDLAPYADSTPLRCLSDHVEFYRTLLTMTLGPVVIVLLRAGLYYWHRRAFVATGRVAHSWGQTESDIVVVLFLTQPLASKVAFQTFICTDRLDDGGSYLEADLTLRCDTKRHTIYSAFAGLMVAVWPVGVTALFGVALYNSRRLIHRIWRRGRDPQFFGPPKQP